jgi:ketosteroid isomerase-like protein
VVAAWRSGREEDVMATQASGGLDFEALRRAIEERDLDPMLDLYADDAELRIINRNTTPSSPQVLRGREEISEYLRDVFSREMTHRVENEVVGENRVAFNEACEYPDGIKVLAAETVELREGKIVRQVNVETWDE